MNKLKLSRILMMGTILLIAAFQCYWLNNLYHSEEQSISKTADVVFRESLYKMQADRFKGDSLFFRKGAMANDIDIFLGDISHTLKNRIPDSAPPAKPNLTSKIKVMMNASSGKPETDRRTSSSGVYLTKHDTTSNIFIRRFNDSPRLERVTLDGHTLDTTLLKKLRGRIFTDPAGIKNISVVRHGDSTIRFQIDGSPQSSDSSKFIKKIFVSSKTLNDSIPLNKIDTFYKNALHKAGLNITFSIVRDTSFKRKKDTVIKINDTIHTTRVPVGFMNPVSYQAEFKSPTGLILQKIAPQIGLSLILILLTLFSFVFLYRNLVAQQKLAGIKNEFISNITHELKTPIATVAVAIEALRNFGGIQSPEKTKEYLDISASELQRLSLLVDKVLKLSMFENKEIELRKEVFDWKQLTEEVMSTMKLQFEKHKAQVTLTSEGETFLINADKLHVTSVVYNLLDNALKYSTNKPEIRVSLKSDPQYVELQVRDQGIGIPDEYKQKIFEKFFRVPTGDRHNTKGYGLGLSYVSHVVKQHNGSIHVQSEAGKGSVFTIKLPVA